jgi:hypothetical protein
MEKEIVRILNMYRLKCYTIEEAKKELLNLYSVIVPKGTFYCDCVQPSMQKPISETEYECFDCGKEVKQ